MLIPLLIVFYAGELVWRERDAGLSEIADATPVPEWVFFLGKFLGLGLVLVVWMALLTAAGVLGQARMGYFDFEIGLYLRILFGMQLVDYLLFALLVFAVHAVVNQKQVGYLVALIAYGFIAFASTARDRAQAARLWIRSRLDLHGHARLRRVARAVALVQAVLGSVGAAAGRGGDAAVGARDGAQCEVAAPLGARPIHSSGGRGGRNGGDAHPLGGRFHLLQHERAARLRHGRRPDEAQRRVREAIRTVLGDPAAPARRRRHCASRSIPSGGRRRSAAPIAS